MAVQADGSVLVIGSSGSRDYTEIVVVRLRPRGDLDSTFGTGGVVRLQPVTGSGPEAFGGSIPPDGNTLVVVGQMRQMVGGRRVVKALAGSRARLNTKLAKAIDASVRSALADRLTALERDAKTLSQQPY